MKIENILMAQLRREIIKPKEAKDNCANSLSTAESRVGEDGRNGRNKKIEKNGSGESLILLPFWVT